ncbi:MAG: hypothetical protein II642_03320 [Firmicutes bacterium]|nr:hypothetical protein [Bacillota bacterium]
MKTKQLLSILLSFVLVLGLLSGCTPKDKTEGESSTQEGSGITVKTDSDSSSQTETSQNSESSQNTESSQNSQPAESSQASESSENTESSKTEESSKDPKPEESSQSGGSVDAGESSESSESSENSESSTTESSTTESSTTESSTTESSQTEESSESSGGAQTYPLVLFDNEYMTLILTDVYENMGLMCEVQAINKTDKELEISLTNEAVNGFNFNLYWWNMLMPGETSNQQMYIQDGWLENIGLTASSVSTFSFTFKGAYSTDGENWVEFYEDCVIYPN